MRMPNETSVDVMCFCVAVTTSNHQLADCLPTHLCGDVGKRSHSMRHVCSVHSSNNDNENFINSVDCKCAQLLKYFHIFTWKRGFYAESDFSVLFVRSDRGLQTSDWTITDSLNCPADVHLTSFWFFGVFYSSVFCS